jgi:hypothetical protein
MITSPGLCRRWSDVDPEASELKFDEFEMQIQ